MSSPPRNSRFSKKSPSSAKNRNRAENGPKSGQNEAYRPSKGKNGASSRTKSTSKPSSRGSKPLSQDWIWGAHAAMAALNNKDRTIHELLLTEAASRRLTLPTPLPQGLQPVQTDPAQLDRKVGDASHQGIAVRASAPRDMRLDELAEPAEGLIVVLDQVTDPHNVGAIFRLCAAFGARGLIMQDRKAPPLSGATAKVAVGCVETVPHALVSNIANTLLDLRERGWIVTGLAGEGPINVAQAVTLPKNATAPANVIVMGAEGPGLRPRVRDCCDHLAHIPMPGGAESLNVSTAAAIAMYETIRSLKPT